MTEENTDPNEGGNTSTDDGEAFQAITSQEQLDKLIGSRINAVKSKYADYDDLKTKAAKFDEAEQANKSELQKLSEERNALLKERDTLQLSQLKAEVGTAKGLTAAQARRLVGSTKEELEADADALLADFKPAGSTKPPAKRLQSGSAGGDTSSGKERAAAAMRSLRNG